MILNKHINEDMRFEALTQLREIQSNLVAISFLSVISIMKPENPLKSEVLDFQDNLDKLTMQIQSFISKAKNDIDYEPSEEEEEELEGAVEPEEDEPKKEVKDKPKKEVKDKPKKEDEPKKEVKDKPKKEDEVKNEPEDSSRPIE
jgi:outer membrane biosynthesis protein TonB